MLGDKAKYVIKRMADDPGFREKAALYQIDANPRMLLAIIIAAAPYDPAAQAAADDMLDHRTEAEQFLAGLLGLM